MPAFGKSCRRCGHVLTARFDPFPPIFDAYVAHFSDDDGPCVIEKMIELAVFYEHFVDYSLYAFKISHVDGLTLDSISK
jgi:hypothetical protein